MNWSKILYWLSVVGPLADIIKGAILGIKEAIVQSKNQDLLDKQYDMKLDVETDPDLLELQQTIKMKGKSK